MKKEFSQSDREYMTLALALAKRGEGAVLPNPMVGAVIVKEGRIIGKGYHACYGDIHGEVAALNDCTETPSGATLYVTLEPCCHRSEKKHNPPCTDAILKAAISRVVIARLDPNPSVSGKGAQLLSDKGLQVEWGLCERESAQLNRVYETLFIHQRPFIHIKTALSLDGFMAAEDGSSKWISGPESRSKVMEMRRHSQAILCGRGTLFSDKPSLTIRNNRGEITHEKQPLRVVLSSSGKLPQNWPQTGGDWLVYTASEGLGEHFVTVGKKEGKLDFEAILKDLYERGIFHILIEGGSSLLTSVIKGGFWDKLSIFKAPILLGSGIPLTSGLGKTNISEKIHLNEVTSETFGSDTLISGYRKEILCSQD